MRIADVHFLIGGETYKSIQTVEPAYKPFLTHPINHSVIGAEETRISLQFGAIPPTEGLTRLFDNGESWSMFQAGDGYCLAIQPPSFKQPIVLARIDAGFTQATVYVDKERVSQGKKLPVLSNPIGYPLLQILLIYILAHRQGALFHAAGIGIKERGYLFPGRSGAGKSTITRLFAGRKDIALLSDDRMAVRKIDGAFKAYGTPWPGDAGIAENESMPLAGIFFISHGSENRIREISRREALERMLPVTSIPWYDQRIVPHLLDFCEDLTAHVPAVEFHLKPIPEAIDVFEEYILSH